jgi:tRNA(Ile)-lysidine synthase TilS/MesJ
MNSLRGSLPSGGHVGFDVSTLGGRVALYIIEPFALKARNKVVKLSKGKARVDLIVVGDTLDDEAMRTMKSVMQGKAFRESARIARPLARCPESEVKAYARIKKIKAPGEKRERGFDSILREELDLIEGKHPGTKYAILNAGRYLGSLE